MLGWVGSSNHVVKPNKKESFSSIIQTYIYYTYIKQNLKIQNKSTEQSKIIYLSPIRIWYSLSFTKNSHLNQTHQRKNNPKRQVG